MEKQSLKNYVTPKMVMECIKQEKVLCSSNYATEEFEREEEINL